MIPSIVTAGVEERSGDDGGFRRRGGDGGIGYGAVSGLGRVVG